MKNEPRAPISLPQRSSSHAPSEHTGSLGALPVAFEESLAGVVFTDPDGIILHVNAAFVKMTGFTRDELIGVPAASLRGTSPEPDDPWPAPSGETAWAGRSWNRRKDGEFYWALVSISPIRNAGDVTAYVAIHQELPAVPPASEGDASPTAAARLADTSPEFVLILDPDSTIRFINTTVPGLNRDHVIGSSVYEFAPPDQHDILRTHIERVLASGERSTYEITAIAAHGTSAPYVTHVGPLMHNGEIIALVLTSNPLAPPAIEDSDATETTTVPGGPKRDQPRVTLKRGGSKASSSKPARGRGRRVDLTERELGVLTLLGQGLTNRELADRLKLSQRTVDHHVSHILAKLRVSNRTAAVVAAEQSGMLKGRKTGR